MGTSNFQSIIDKAFQDLVLQAFDFRIIKEQVCPYCEDGQLVMIDSQDTYVIIECMACGKIVGVQIPADADTTNNELMNFGQYPPSQ